MSVQEEIRTTVDELLKALSTKNIMGDPIEVDGKTVITITKLGIGVGAGGGEGRAMKGDATGSGSGAGGAGGVSPVAVIVIDKGVAGPDGVKVLPLAAPSGLGRAIGEVASTLAQRMGQRGGPASEDRRSREPQQEQQAQVAQ